MHPVRLIAPIALSATLTSAHADDCERIAIWRDGHAVGELCRGDAGEHELAILDLSDDWVPPVFAAGEDSGPGYRPTYLALAQERFADAGGDAALATTDRYSELFGIAPNLGVVRTRLGDEVRRIELVPPIPVDVLPGRIHR